MDSYFYNHRYYVKRPKKRQKQYKFVWDNKAKRYERIEIIPKPNPEYLHRIRRLYPDFDQWDFEKQISMMGEDDAE